MNSVKLFAVSVSLLVAVTLWFAGCEQKKAPSAPPAGKEEAAKAIQPEPAPAVPAAAEPAPGTAPEPQPEPKAEEPVAQPEAQQPSPAAQLAELTARTPAPEAAGADVAAFLQSLKAFREANPDAPEAVACAVQETELKTRFLLSWNVSGATGMFDLMTADGALAQGTLPDPSARATYLKGIAAAAAALAPKTAAEQAARLNGIAALMNFWADYSLETAGVSPGNTLTLPESWKTPSQDAAAAPKAADKPADKPAEPERPVLARGGVDIGTLDALLAPDSPVAKEALLYTLSLVKSALAQAAQVHEFPKRWLIAADGMGKLACDACGQLLQVPFQYRPHVMVMKENRGLLCEEAVNAEDPDTCPGALLPKYCATAYGLGAEDAHFLTPVNALLLRVLQVSTRLIAFTPAAGESPLDPQIATVRAELAAALGAMVALAPPLMGTSMEKWGEKKETLVLNSGLSREVPASTYQPLELVLVDENGVSAALRPVVSAKATTPTFLESGEGYHMPGKTVATLASIEAELKEKEEKLKAEKAKYSDRFKAYVHELVVKGAKFEKPDYSIPSVIEAAKELGSKAQPFEMGAFAPLVGEGFLNHQRPSWDSFPDTVGKAALFAVDVQTPALLFKRVLDSLFYADYKDDRLVKGTRCMGTIPTVYYTERFVEDSVLDTTYRRPVLVLVTEGGTIRFYPPAERSALSRMEPKRSPSKRNRKWPARLGIETTDPRIPDEMWNTFMVHTSVKNKDWEKDVAGIGAEMQTKWDNGNVFYIMADDKAESWIVVQVADILSRLPGTPLAQLGTAFPGYVCDVEAAPEQCIQNIVVLFPEVEIPSLPGRRKVEEVQQNVYCDNKDIAMRIKNKYGAFRFCYESELQKNRDLKGRVVFNFTIGADGRVRAINASANQLGNPKVVNCAMDVIKGIQFKRPIGGECVIQHPYLFSP